MPSASPSAAIVASAPPRLRNHVVKVSSSSTRSGRLPPPSPSPSLAAQEPGEKRRVVGPRRFDALPSQRANDRPAGGVLHEPGQRHVALDEPLDQPDVLLDYGAGLRLAGERAQFGVPVVPREQLFQIGPSNTSRSSTSSAWSSAWVPSARYKASAWTTPSAYLVHPRRVEHALAGVGCRRARSTRRRNSRSSRRREPSRRSFGRGGGQVCRRARHRGVGHVDDEPVFKCGRVDRAGVEPVDRLERAVGEGGVVDRRPPALVLVDGFDHDPPVVAEFGEPLAPHPSREVVVIGRSSTSPAIPYASCAMFSTWIGSSVTAVLRAGVT